MNISIGIYILLIAVAFIGAILTWSSYRNRKLLISKRWRIKVNETNIQDYPPFSWIKPYLDKKKKEKMDIEIYEAISFLRNITSIGGEFISADSILDQLKEHRGLLSPIYSRMLRLLRQNQKEEAIKYFYDAVGTEISKDFARLLIQWDEINPKDLMEILLSHQRNIKEVRLTIQKRRDEMISDFIYLPVVFNVMLIFINFIYVSYLLDQKEMLMMLF
ncbi:MAG: hypothetical protein GX363_01820 [Clostridiales bacterium]|jgi:hypothetical protein|nr:hypothetical protein [Clostridiales bacterium]